MILMKHENGRPLTFPPPATSECINRQIAIYLECGELLVSLQAALIQEGYIPLELNSLEELVWITDEDFPVAIGCDSN